MAKPVLWSSTFTSGTMAHLAAAEAGADFDIRFISLKKGEHRTPEYLAMNPKGQVPALDLGGGRVVTEFLAILTYIARTHPASGLMPSDPYAEARTLGWLGWISALMGSSILPSFMPSRFTADPAAEASVAARGRERVAEALAFAEAELARGEVPGGENGGLGLAEIGFFFLGMGVRFLKFEPADYPALGAHYARIAARPRIAAALAREREIG